MSDLLSKNIPDIRVDNLIRIIRVVKATRMVVRVRIIRDITFTRV